MTSEAARAFVQQIQAGDILRGREAVIDSVLYDSWTPLDLTDLDLVAAEAINRGVFAPETTWASVRRQIAEAVAEVTA